MSRTLYKRLAIGLMAAFVVPGALLLLAAELLSGSGGLLGLAAIVAAGGLASSLAGVCIVHHCLSRQLRGLVEAIDAVRPGCAGALMRAAHPATGLQRGDDLDRLRGACQDLSERIASQLLRLEQADLLRRELLASVAHDLRTPLTVMQGYLELLQHKADRQTQQERRMYLDVVARQCQRLGRLVHDLFELATLEACEARPDMEIFPINELAQDVIRKFSLAAEECSLTLVARCQGGALPVRADIGMIERILDNLIENAMRATPAGGQIGIGIHSAGQRVELRVSDSGKGMTSAELGSIFGRRCRAGRGLNGGAAHAGLGLAIARRLAQLHGGDVVVQSTPGQGTTFIIDLPAACCLNPAAPP